MTPEREAYLENCSNREVWLRSAIVATKRDVSYQKQRITNANDEWIVTGAKCELWHEKQLLMTLRHELARLKGMDRVFSRGKAPVKQPEFHSGIKYSAFYCGDCGYIVEVVEDDGEFKKSAIKFCPYCGRRILWEKVSE